MFVALVASGLAAPHDCCAPRFTGRGGVHKLLCKFNPCTETGSRTRKPNDFDMPQRGYDCKSGVLGANDNGIACFGASRTHVPPGCSEHGECTTNWCKAPHAFRHGALIEWFVCVLLLILVVVFSQRWWRMKRTLQRWRDLKQRIRAALEVQRLWRGKRTRAAVQSQRKELTRARFRKPTHDNLLSVCFASRGRPCSLLTACRAMYQLFRLIDASGDGEVSLPEFMVAHKSRWVSCALLTTSE